jgi:hypothetical protein
MTSEELYAKERNLKNEIVETIQTLVGDEKVDLKANSFDDEANNRLDFVDKNSVYSTGNDIDYPLHELGINDAIYIVALLEN